MENNTSFENMNLKENLLRGVFGYGFEKPSKIQSKAIIPLSNGDEIVAQSQSGTGKTGAFVIGTLNRIDEDLKACQAIILSPTRELSTQIVNVCNNIGRYLDINYILCVGGSNINYARKNLSGKASVVVGTPGRVIDMMKRRYLDVSKLKTLILDEADEMLSSSFTSQLKSIIGYIPEKSQICFFSATITQNVLDLSEKILMNPKKILIKKEELTLEGIKQYYINVEREGYKFDTLCDIYGVISINQTMIYVNTKKRAEILARNLIEEDFTVSVIHSKLSQTERSNIMKDFRNGNTRILISTDLLSRGIDIQQVSMVINYDIPFSDNKESYIHRIGRSGRFGRKGCAINFVTDRDINRLNDLESFYHTQIQPLPENFNNILS